MALQEAGCFSVVLECVPPPVAAAATSALHIPTIGIGAGPFCSGQVRFETHYIVLWPFGFCIIRESDQHTKSELSTIMIKCVIFFLLIQVLVYHDLLGMMQHPHHAKVKS